jgi:transcriptional regulator with XRE-family HTH domain
MSLYQVDDVNTRQTIYTPDPAAGVERAGWFTASDMRTVRPLLDKLPQAGEKLHLRVTETTIDDVLHGLTFIQEDRERAIFVARSAFLIVGLRARVTRPEDATFWWRVLDGGPGRGVGSADVVGGRVAAWLAGALGDDRPPLPDEVPVRGAELRLARLYMGLSQEEMANLIGMSPRNQRDAEITNKPIHVGVSQDVRLYVDLTRRALDVNWARADDTHTPVRVHRFIDELEADQPHLNWPLGWHQHVCAQTAEEAQVPAEWVREGARHR